MRTWLLCLIVLFVSSALAGCGARRAAPPALEIDLEIEGYAGGEANAIGFGEQDLDEELILNSDISNLREQQIIYFAYDSKLVTKSGRAVMRAHAKYLKKSPNVQVILEGHTDERGTREYNLALAENRARSVANLMQSLGVSANRIQAISYGEERPLILAHDENAWRMNRRVEILYNSQITP